MTALAHRKYLPIEQFTLPRFTTRQAERTFWRRNDRRKFGMRRFFLFFGVLAFLAHGMLDLSAGGEQAYTLLVLRTVCVVAMLILAYVFSRRPEGIEPDSIVIAYLFFPAVTIVAMTVIVDAGTAADTYPFGLVILFAYGGAVLVPRCVKMIGLCLSVYLIHLLSLPFTAISGGALVVNGFFVTVGLLAICIGSLTRERLEREQMKVEISIGELNRDLEFSREEALVSRDAAIEARKIQAKFITSISHELRTPLNAIIGFSDLMLNEIDGPVTPSSYQGYVRDIHRSGKGLLLNINDLLDVHRLNAGKMSWTDNRFDVGNMIGDAVRVCAHEADAAGVSLVHDSAAPFIEAFGDPDRMTQVITNLLTNALKFTDPGGRVSVQHGLTEKQELRISVSDTGIGIAAKDLERIKNPFQQGEDGTLAKKKGGLGLGLAIVGGIVKQMDSRFEIESEPGVGTVCHVFIPRVRLFIDEAASVA